MRIKRLKIYKNVILGDIDISFMDNNMNTKNQIFLAGENGCGKTTLLDTIYEFVSGIGINRKECNEINEFTIEFSEEEINILKTNRNLRYYFEELAKGCDVVFRVDYSQKYATSSSIEYKNDKAELVVKENTNIMFSENIRNVLRGVYSTAEINFISDNINYVTSKNLDDNINSIRQNSNLATEISQLLVDIKALDDSDLADWVNENPGIVPADSIKEVRIKRFKSAFDYIFEGKKFKGISNVDGKKEIIFEENGVEVPINKLSSGEKQIVFRGGFLLKDSNRAKGAIILIDEPELSLHPKWQMKIADFFRKIFEDDKGNQTSQIIMSTHSPFILHNKNRVSDKVVVLKKDKVGNIIQLDKPKFYYCNNEEIIKDAFDIDSVIESIKKEREKTLIITEGKTDWKHMKKSYEKLLQNGGIEELDIEFLEYEEALGDSRLYQLFEYISMLNNHNKIICIFDRDKPDIVKKVINSRKDYRYNKNKVYSMVIPIPKSRESISEICIEHLYLDEDIKREKDGKRIYIGNEFSRKSGIHNEKNEIFCMKKDKCGSDSYKIIDSDCWVASHANENKNIAMSKNEFADNIVFEVEEFKDINFEGFKPLFQVIGEIVKLED